MAEFFGNDYARRREEIYGPLRRQGVFTWDAMYGEEYALASVLPISGVFRAELKRASEELGQIFAKTATVVMQAGDELPAELGLPAAAWPAGACAATGGAGRKAERAMAARYARAGLVNVRTPAAARPG